jgi:hypothetical protein
MIRTVDDGWMGGRAGWPTNGGRRCEENFGTVVEEEFRVTEDRIQAHAISDRV